MGVVAGTGIAVTVETTVESSADFTTAGATTHHHLVIDKPPFAATAWLELVADGNFGTALEFATAIANDDISVRTPSAGVECAPAVGSRSLSASALAALTTSGTVDVDVTNSLMVAPACDHNRHTIRLRYETLADRLDFNDVRVGAEKTIVLTVRNPAAVAATVQLGSDTPVLRPDETSLIVDPQGERQTVVRFAPVAPGRVNGTLTLTNSLPGVVPISISLTGTGAPPPSLLVNPGVLSSTLPFGGSQSQTFTIANFGDHTFDFELRVEGPGPHPPRHAVALDGGPLSLVTIDLDTGQSVRTSLGMALSGARAVALDPSGSLVYIATYFNGLYSMPFPSGPVTQVSNGFSGIVDVTPSRDGQYCFLLDQAGGRILRLDLADGSVQSIASGLNTPMALEVSPTDGELLILEYDRLVRVNLSTGVITPVAISLGSVSALGVDRGRRLAYVTSYVRGLIRVDLSTGAVSAVLPDAQPQFTAVSLMGDGRQALLLDADAGRVDQIDLASGTRMPVFLRLTVPRDLAALSDDSGPVDFLTLDPIEGAIPASGTQAVTAHFLAGTLPAGEYAAAVVLRQAEVSTPVSIIPASLTIVSSPHLEIIGPTHSAEVTEIFHSAFYNDTLLTLSVPLPEVPHGPGTLEVTTEATLWSYMPVSVEGRPVGSDPTVQCVRTTRSYPLSSELLSQVSADGVVDVELSLQRVEDFGIECGVNRFTAKLSYPGDGQSIDFGIVEAGERRIAMLTLRNAGDENLQLDSFQTTGDGFSLEQPDLVLPPGSEVGITVNFAPTTPGKSRGELQFNSNEFGAGSVRIPLVGSVLSPAMASVQAAAISISLPEGSTRATEIVLENSGGVPLDYSVRVRGRPPEDPRDTSCTPRFLLASLHPIPLASPAAQVTSLNPIQLSGNVFDEAIDGTGRAVFITTGPGNGGVFEVNRQTGHEEKIAGLPFPQGVALSHDEKIVYVVANGLFSVDRATLRLEKIVDFDSGQGLALDAAGTTAYVTSGAGSLMAVDLNSRAIRTITSELKAPQGLALAPGDANAYVVQMYGANSDFFNGSLVKVDLASGAVSAIRSGLEGAESVVLDPSSTVAYVGEDAGCRILAINLATGQSSVVTDGICPYGMALLPVAECSGGFLDLTTRTGSVAASSSFNLPVGVDASSLLPGTYSALVEVSTNDPQHPLLSVPINVHVLPDHDKDGVADANDNCPARANVDQADRDGDRVGDVCDDCPAVADPGQADSNGDGAGDACQARAEVVAIRQDGGQFLEVQAHISDPQNEALAGTVTIAPAAGTGAAAGSGAVAETGAALTTVRGGAPIVLIPFVGRLPRTIDLASLTPAASYRLTISVTNGNTPAFTAAGDFRFQGEPQLAFDDPPVAALSLPATIECNRPGGAGVVLSGAGSLDPDSTPGTRDDIRSYAWILDPDSPGEASLGTGEALEATIPLGAHTIALRVTDSIGEIGQAGVAVMVVDTTPPAATLTADPAVLFPPNHTMRLVRLVWQVVDVCDPAPAVKLLSAGSSEPDDAAGEGDGQTTGDVQASVPGPAPATIGLRAERSGAGGGRIYEIRAQVGDASGNTTLAATSIVVPHDQGQSPEPLILRLQRPAGGGTGVRISWTSLAEAESYDVIAGDLAAWRAEGGLLRLGSVRVLARGITFTTVQEPTNVAAPPIGHAFFYLVQERVAGAGLGYGTVSAARPRVPDSCLGGCP
ncbi:MAG TPA: choice-of-anchor D domain-containing protein [Patescibacteria group bacterium]|nr:choice-of-anchor D domain-containing protein [Patescibacteria group bacterium]